MPQFSGGESKVAVAQMTNPTGKAFSYSATLYMGVNMVAMAAAQFDLGPGETGEIRFSVTMPQDPGVYPVYLDVWSGEILLGHYQATEDVKIVPPSGQPGDFEYTGISCSAPQKPDSTWHYLVFKATVTNVSAVSRTREIELWEYDDGRHDWGVRDRRTVALGPGQSYSYSFSGSTVARNCTVRMYLMDNVGDKSSTCTCYT